MKKFVVSMMMLSAVALGARQGTAEVIATRVRTAPLTVPGTAAVFVPLNNAGSTAMTIVTTQDNQRVVISYNAECQVVATNQTTALSINILVDGVQVPPSDSDNAFCTSDNVAGNWVSAVTTGVLVIQEPGLHTVQVQAQVFSGHSNVLVPPGSVATLDDTSIIVMK
jgi:hypothetical protein